MDGAHSRGRDWSGTGGRPWPQGGTAMQHQSQGPKNIGASILPAFTGRPPQLPLVPSGPERWDSPLCSFSTPTAPPLQRLPGDPELSRQRWPWGWGKRTLATNGPRKILIPRR